jgi:hypothetical protein
MRTQVLMLLLILVTTIATLRTIVLIYRWRLEYLPQIVGAGGPAFGGMLVLLGNREAWVFFVFFLGSIAGSTILGFYMERRRTRKVQNEG